MKVGEKYVRTTGNAYHLECESAIQTTFPRVVVCLIESELHVS